MSPHPRIAIPADLPADIIGGRDRFADLIDLGGETMGTSWSLRLTARASAVPPTLKADLDAILADIIAQMSNWDATSAISCFNRAPLGQPQPLPPRFASVLRAALTVAQASDGAFDPTVGALSSQWGFLPPQGSDGGAAADWRAIDLQEHDACRTADVTLDFSGIAKGDAVDALAEHLRTAGYRHFLVEIGGELRGEGVKPDGQPWWVDLEVPPGLTLPPMRVALCGLSVATSGDYRRFVERDGRRYPHSFDPRTGRPVDNGIASATVLHPSAMMADAWATAISVLGVEAGLRIAAREGLAVLLVERRRDGSGKEWMSPAFTAMLSE